MTAQKLGPTYLAFDVGGTTIKAAVFAADGQILSTKTYPTNKNVNETIMTTLLEATSAFKETYPLAGIGVASAGRISKDGAIAYAGPTIPDYTGTPLKATLTAAFGLPVEVINDVDAALLGELSFTALDKSKPTYCVALGTGIGGAFWVNGHLYGGAHGLANSVGYLDLDQKDESTFETRASTLALEHQLAPYQWSVKEGFERAKAGDAQAVVIIRRWIQQLGTQLAQVCLLLDPEVIVVGGAVAAQGDYLINNLTKATYRAMPAGFGKAKMVAAKLGAKAQLYGAASFFVTPRVIEHREPVMA